MSRNILIVDDSPLIHILIKKAIDKAGCVICGNAKNGKEGVELYQKLSPDVTFMDINMPVMDGLEAAKMIKGINPSAVIIMLTAVGDDETLSKAKVLGVDIFLNKPFDTYKIISALAQV